MNSVLIATIAGLLTAFCWGTSDWLSARGAKKLTVIEVNFGVQASSLVMTLGLLLVAGFHHLSAAQLTRVTISSVLITAAYLLFVKALSSGAVGIIVPLGNIYPLFTLILSLIFLQAHFSGLQIGAMSGIVLGASLLAYEKNHHKIPLRELHRETILALCAAVIWGLAYFVVDPVVNEVPWQTITIVSEIVMSTLAIIFIVIANPHRAMMAISRSLRSRVALLTGVFGELGLMALYFGSSRAGSVVIPAVLSAGSPLVASFLGWMIDHEKVGIIKRVGAVVVVAGIIALNVN